MPKAYSRDLRERVIAACEAEELTRAEIARQFDVGETTLYHWLSRWRTEGTLQSRPHAGGHPSPLDRTVLKALVHKYPEIEAAIQGAGCKLLFLPRYSPEFNPIEPCWSKLKNELRSRAARTLESLQSAVNDAMQTITAQNAHGWFLHCGYTPTPDP